MSGRVAHGGEVSAAMYERQVMTAIQQGASAEEIAAALMALLPTVGAGRLTAAAALIWPALGEVTGASPAAWMLGSVVGYAIGYRGGRKLLDHPGRFEKSRRKLLAKGDRPSPAITSWRP
jgi:membrane protein DedA with SNARE-associated domain